MRLFLHIVEIVSFNKKFFWSIVACIKELIGFCNLYN